MRRYCRESRGDWRLEIGDWRWEIGDWRLAVKSAKVGRCKVVKF
jgi:hypothetical protein